LLQKAIDNLEAPVNLRRLKYFVKIVDVGSLTQASEVLHVAQPALSQQIATLEGEFKQQLLLRTQKGVEPTEAGKALYRHAQLILRQFEQAQADVLNAGRALSGQVSVGLTPGSAASTLALPLLQTVHGRYPQIVLHINENLGTTLCDVVREGRMDMAVLYGGGRSVQGLCFDQLLTESLFVVAPPGVLGAGDEVTLDSLRDVDLMLPRANNELRRRVDQAFAAMHLVPRVVAEMESSDTLAAAVASGVAATILPGSAARGVAASASCDLRRIASPTIDMPLALCFSDHLPLSEPAQAVKAILLELANKRMVNPVALDT
jgi:LysR family nitrogen assimilation transcriptional regulator